MTTPNETAAEKLDVGDMKIADATPNKILDLCEVVVDCATSELQSQLDEAKAEAAAMREKFVECFVYKGDPTEYVDGKSWRLCSAESFSSVGYDSSGEAVEKLFSRLSINTAGRDFLERLQRAEAEVKRLQHIESLSAVSGDFLSAVRTMLATIDTLTDGGKRPVRPIILGGPVVEDLRKAETEYCDTALGERVAHYLSRLQAAERQADAWKAVAGELAEAITGTIDAVGIDHEYDTANDQDCPEDDTCGCEHIAKINSALAAHAKLAAEEGNRDGSDQAPGRDKCEGRE